jgi:ectoine hydroxylase-related dioxygenase (phytanoyl-CoA dioxygenase family)
MSITEEQLQAYEDGGLIFLPSYFSEAEVEIMKAEVPRVFADSGSGKVMENGGRDVRSVYGAQFNSKTFQQLSRHARIAKPAMAILGSDVYVYQFKINAKAAFGGDIWEWHQDYIFWQKEDGMPAARAANVIIFLDEVNEFNGPLFFIPGSHKEGVIEVPPRETEPQNSHQTNPGWLSNRLKFSLDRETVAQGIAKYGIVAPKGPAGSVLFTHPNIIHCSPNNMSPFDRVVAIITYNSIENIPEQQNQRPEFLSSRDLTPVVPLPEEAWAKAAY